MTAQASLQPPDSPNTPEQVKWVRENAVPFRSVDPLDIDFADLQPLKAILGDAQIVQLGEQSHGDGTCFETKIRLIKFLHQEMGFDVLAFESGFYDRRRAWQSFRDGGAPLQSARQGVFGIWTGSAQTVQLWNYLSEQSQSARPLELCGFDCQFTAMASRNHLLKDLRNLVRQLKVDLISEEEFAVFGRQLEALINHRAPAGSQESFAELLKRLASAVEGNQHLTSEEAAFWKQQLVSMGNHCRQRWNSSSGQDSVRQRDAQMAENLIWLANERYRDRKIIVWAASFHVIRNPPAVEVLGKPGFYDEMIQMGERVHRALGGRVFTIGFTAERGRAGAYFRRAFEVSPAPPGTLESIFAAAGLENGLVPLRNSGPDAKWLEEKHHCRPLGYQWTQARWPDHFDAIIFNRVMTPSTR
ncbi:MAG: erythromycin esterase family protein [Pirellulales bacterium]|nr:erythromycin esterase family protein [Pirellulales bacterium]